MRYTCDKVLELLPLYAGGDLEPKRAIPTEVHLRSCLSCSREWRAIGDVLVDVRRAAHSGSGLEETGGVAAFTASVMAEVRELPGAGTPRWTNQPWFTWGGWSAAAAVLILGTWLRSQPQPAPQPDHGIQPTMVVQQEPNGQPQTPSPSVPTGSTHPDTSPANRHVAERRGGLAQDADADVVTVPTGQLRLLGETDLLLPPGELPSAPHRFAPEQGPNSPRREVGAAVPVSRVRPTRDF